MVNRSPTRYPPYDADLVLDAPVLIHLVHHRLVGADDHTGIIPVKEKVSFILPEEILFGRQVEGGNGGRGDDDLHGCKNNNYPAIPPSAANKNISIPQGLNISLSAEQENHSRLPVAASGFCCNHIRYNAKKVGASNNSISGLNTSNSSVTETYQSGVFSIFRNQ